AALGDAPQRVLRRVGADSEVRRLEWLVMRLEGRRADRRPASGDGGAEKDEVDVAVLHALQYGLVPFDRGGGLALAGNGRRCGRDGGAGRKNHNGKGEKREPLGRDTRESDALIARHVFPPSESSTTRLDAPATTACA